MSALARLASLLQPGAEEGAKAMRASTDIDSVLARMEAASKGRKAGRLSEDHQLEAVRRFWGSPEIRSFRDAYLLSWSLCLPHRPGGPCILEDLPKLRAVLAGIDGWQSKPNAFRRCYQGLVKSYFVYDAHAEHADAGGRSNWRVLRTYLAERNNHIKDERLNPDWVDTAVGNRHLFGDQPCEPYVDALLREDRAAIDHLCAQLSIDKASWFLRELVLAQVKGATRLGNAQFQGPLPRSRSTTLAARSSRSRGSSP
jgi:hypothetical protein